MPAAPESPRLEDTGGRGASADLDARIDEMERRIVTRQQHLVEQTQAVEERVQQALRPRNVLPPLAAVALGAAALWSVVRHPRARRDSAGLPPARSRAIDPPSGRWSRLLEIGRPIVGARLGLGANPTLATILLSAGLPLLRRLLDDAVDRRTGAQADWPRSPGAGAPGTRHDRGRRA